MARMSSQAHTRFACRSDVSVMSGFAGGSGSIASFMPDLTETNSF